MTSTKDTSYDIPSLPSEPWSSSIPQLLTDLQTDVRTGLSSTEVLQRTERFGRNVSRQTPHTPVWRRFLAQFHDPQIYLLLGAALVTGIVRRLEGAANVPYETYIILAIVFMNAILSFLQEDRAERALTALADLMPRQATIVRDGAHQRIPAEELVPGDILILNEGDMVPADARMTQVQSFITNEAPLTGESLPVNKQVDALSSDTQLADRSNMIFAGTVVNAGTATAIVTATGAGTEFGKIASLLTTTQNPTTPLQKQLQTLSKQLGIAVLLIAAGISIALLFANGLDQPGTVLSILLFAIALAVAAAPEGLAAITTLVLAIGVQRMARRGAIVRRLSAVETLGSTTVIASDKTGTMTRNEITVRSIITASAHVDVSGAGYSNDGSFSYRGTEFLSSTQQAEIRELIIGAILANNAHISPGPDAWHIHGDPTEAALLIAAHKGGISVNEIRNRYCRTAEIPFSSERKRMTTVNRRAGELNANLSVTKGAPDVLLDLCTKRMVGAALVPLTPEDRSEILQNNALLAQSAMRVLAIASRHASATELGIARGAEPSSGERDLTFLGLIGMIDPLRPEAKSAVERARTAGIRTILVTGDQPLTAIAVAKELGITSDESCVSGLQLDALSQSELSRIVGHTQIYARVRPEHKLRIVQALQSNDEIVAMTGDGVNDAPALKAAHIGVAMGIVGTDVSKEAADLVLTDDNFSTIVSAIEEGRIIVDNIRKVLRYLLATNLGEVLTLFISAVLLSAHGAAAHTLVLPLTAAQILWINLITDSGPALALGVDPPAADILRRPPRPVDEHILNARMLRGLLPGALAMTAASLSVFFVLEIHQSLARKRTLTFTTLILCQLFNSLGARSSTYSALRAPFQNRWLWFAIMLSIAAQMMVTNIPPLQHAFGLVALSGSDWLQCTLIASSVLLVNELSILLRRRSHGQIPLRNPERP